MDIKRRRALHDHIHLRPPELEQQRPSSARGLENRRV
jgi:hypothetical protein